MTESCNKQRRTAAKTATLLHKLQQQDSAEEEAYQIFQKSLLCESPKKGQPTTFKE
jgi:hypothetical protein